MESNEAAAQPGFGRVALGLLRSMRPRQWTKNIFVFAALIFDAKLLQPAPLIATIIGFIVLCMLSSAVYLVNDSADVQADRAHPKKRSRPIAAGDVPVPLAVGWSIVLVITGLVIAFLTNVMFGLIALTYLIIATTYTFKVKHIVILDVIFLAAGFVLRVAAGIPLVDAERFSPWLFTCMAGLALLIGFGKRRAELVELDGRATTRAILSEYHRASARPDHRHRHGCVDRELYVLHLLRAAVAIEPPHDADGAFRGVRPVSLFVSGACEA